MFGEGWSLERGHLRGMGLGTWDLGERIRLERNGSGDLKGGAEEECGLGLLSFSLTLSSLQTTPLRSNIRAGGGGGD